MRALILDRAPGMVRVADVDLSDEAAGAVVPVAAAALNPVDLAIAAGKLAFRRLPEGAVLGFEGVAEQAPGDYVYFSAPRAPWGSYAQRVDLDGAEVFSIPEGVDPTLAAAVGVPGIAAYLALTKSGRFGTGDRVLVLGGTGSVGRIAVQIAIARGAGTVVATARHQEDMGDLERLGAVAVSAATPDELEAGLQSVAGDGFDVVIDALWGDTAAVAMRHLRFGARFAQVGNAAGLAAQIAAPDFRNRGATLVGHSNFLATPEERADAYAQVVELVRQGALDVEPQVVSLDDLPAAWTDLANGAGRGKVVVVP